LIPLRTKATSSGELQDVVAIFSNLETILEVHKSLYAGILEIQEHCWPVVQGLGRLFMKYASSFQSYGDFAENYKTSQSTLTKILSQKKNRLRETIEANENGGGEHLQNILRMPLQRIEKYETIFAGFCSIPQGVFPNELEILSRVHIIMQNIQELVNRSLQRADQYAINQEIGRSIIADRPLNLHQDERYVVNKGTMFCTQLKKIHYFLFVDLLLITKSQGEKYRLIHYINLEDADIELLQTDKNGKELYELTFGDKKMRLYEDKKQDTFNHIPLLADQILKHKKTGLVFGVHLTELLAREGYTPNGTHSGVPNIVTFLVNYLRNHAIKTEGLLRLPGNFERIEAARKLLDNAKLTNYDEIDLSPYDVHDVAAVLRIFFRELPEPVIPFDLYEPLLKIQRDANIPLDTRISEIKKVLQQIPQAHLPILQYLIKFLQDVEEHCEVNKMTVSNLAIVFGPNIIKPKVETVQNALEMPLLQGIIQLLMEHSEAFWGNAVRRRTGKTKRTRPLSVIFVGTDLTAMMQTEDAASAPVDASEDHQFRSLSRSSPGCNDDVNQLASSTDEEPTDSTVPEPAERLSSDELASTENENESAEDSEGSDCIPEVISPVNSPAVQTRKSATMIDLPPHPDFAKRSSDPVLKVGSPRSENREQFKKTDKQRDVNVPAKRSSSLGGHHVQMPFRKKKVKRLLNL